MTYQRQHRSGRDVRNPFDWAAEARARGIDWEQARSLYDDARRRIAEEPGYVADPAHALEVLYLDLLDEAAAVAQRVPGKRSLVDRTYGAGVSRRPTVPGKSTRLEREMRDHARTWLRGSQPLDPVVQRRMDRLFGFDFAGVRVHVDSPEATGATRAVVKDGEVHFREGAYAPGTAEGDRVIAHELAHVVQQRGGLGMRWGAVSELEREADVAAAQVARGEAARIALRAPAAAAYAFSDDESHDVDAPASHDGPVVPAAVPTTGSETPASGDAPATAKGRPVAAAAVGEGRDEAPRAKHVPAATPAPTNGGPLDEPGGAARAAGEGRKTEAPPGASGRDPGALLDSLRLAPPSRAAATLLNVREGSPAAFTSQREEAQARIPSVPTP